MDFNKRIIDIISGLEQPKWKDYSLFAKNLVAIALAAFPAGGSVSAILDKVGDYFLQPDIKNAVVRLSETIRDLVPEIEKLPKIEGQIGGMLVLLKQNKALMDKLEKICAGYNKMPLDSFWVYTDNSLQEIIGTTIKDMDVKIEAHNGGENILYRFKTTGGDVQFFSTGASHQRIEESLFEGRNGKSVSMNNLKVSGPIRASGSKIIFGPGGKIGFGSSGRIDFGRKDGK